jgi:hypothetical protein
MIRIAITQAAFDAIAATLPFGDTGYENAANERGERLMWLPRNVRDWLNARCADSARATAMSSCASWMGERA